MKLAFALDGRAQVHVTQPVTGGGFGGKEEYPSMIAAARGAPRAAERAAREDDLRPAEDIEATTKRHPARVTHRHRLRRGTGRIVALDVDVVIDGGAYVTLSQVVLSRGCIHAAGAVPLGARPHRGAAVATNTPPHGAFRGFGAPQSLWAIERHMDGIARAPRASTRSRSACRTCSARATLRRRGRSSREDVGVARCSTAR